MGLEKKVEELAEKVDNLQQKNNELEQRNRKLEQKIEKHIKNGKKQKKPEKNTPNKVSRRKFLKMLGVGAGGLALSSSVAGSWSIVRPSGQGSSDINAEIAGGLESSVVGDGLKNGQSSALRVEPADFAGSYLQDDGNDNLEVDTSSVATRSWVNSNADVPNADYADNADQLDGNDASGFVSSSDLSNHENDSNAHHTPPSLNSDSGTFTENIEGDSGITVTVYFTSTFSHASPTAVVTGTQFTNTESTFATWKSWNTDGNGDINGMDIRVYNNSAVQDITTKWQVFGIEA